MANFQDAFISYGRADSKAFAKQLNDRLVAEQLGVWFDFDDIPLGVDYQNQIDAGIEQADNFIYIIAPHSVNSPYCGKEIELALRCYKRIIPILHVEQITQETWQQRNPQGTDEQWEIYKAKGAHSSFPNMHPEVAKINWIYCREGLDDFDSAFQGLLAILNRQKSYVHEHTVLLNQALDWERQQKQSRYLLVGEERQQAEAWLKVRFKDEQAPCVPSPLHCEFITESIKNSHNLMTQVFLSYAEEEIAIMEQVRQSLRREGFTVWTNTTDIQTGVDFQVAINQGIEGADNIVYLLSPAALASSYCQQEIDYALALNKRIIPLLVKPTALEEIPPILRNLQYIDLSDNVVVGDYEQDESKLLRILRQDATYHEAHKMLLTKALKWDRQHRNPSILLRGNDLKQSEAWLKVANQRDYQPPTPLIEDYIAESLRQPPGVSLDVFVSYSRRDSEFARRVNDALQIQGKTTWFDQESIVAGSTDFQQEINRGIESSDHFLFIISPAAIASPYCAEEVEYAATLHKRIITVLYQATEPSLLPPALAAVQWIDFNQNAGDFNANFSILLRTLENDPEYLRTHTWLLTRALEWEHKHRDEGLLLRGQALQDISEWLLSSETKSPQPTTLQRDYVTSANGSEIQRQRLLLRLQRLGLGGISIMAGVAIAAGLLAVKQSHKADRLERTAQQESVLTKTRTSEAMFDSERVLDALLEAMQAAIQMQQQKLATPELQAAVVTALSQPLFWVRERQRLTGHDSVIWTVSVSADGKWLASASADGSAKVWRMDGTLVKTLEHRPKREMLAVAFSPDGQWLATAAADGQVSLWQTRTWTAIPLKGTTDAVWSLAFAPNGQSLAGASNNSRVYLWSAQRGKFAALPTKTLKGHDAAVRSVSFSPDGQLLASASDDRTVRLWHADGTPMKTLVGHVAQVRSVSFSPDSQRLVSGSWDETIRLWRRDGTPLQTLRGHETLIHTVSFSPDGQRIASSGWDKTIKLWTLDGLLVSTLAGHNAQVRSVVFNPKDGTLISAGGDRSWRIWQLQKPLLAILQDHHAKVYSSTFSPDGQLFASGGADNKIRLWNAQGKPLRVFLGHTGVVWSVHFSPDGQKLLSASSDQTVKLWSRHGQLLHSFEGHSAAVYAAVFSPDGKFMASAGADQIVRLWRLDGTLVWASPNFKQSILGLAFSRDSQTLAISGADTDVQLWKLDGTLKTRLHGHSGWVYDVAFSPDGQRILTGSYDNTAKLWTIDGTLLTTLKGHEDGVVNVDFSRDGQTLVTASHDHTVKLWRPDGTLITTLRGHRERVSDASLSPDGSHLVTASEDQTVLLWKLDFQGDLDKLLQTSCQWVNPYLQANRATAHWSTLQQFCQSPSARNSL